jgi:hypothetical protein
MNHTIKSAGLAVMIILCPASAVMAQAPRQCLTQAEAQALLSFALPNAFDTLSDQCRATLPATAVLSRSGHVIAQRYRPEAEAAWPAARKAFGKIGDPAIIRLLDDAILKTIVRAGIASELPRMVTVKDCPLVERFVAALEPLPARNMAMLAGALIEVGAKNQTGARRQLIDICPALPAPKAPAP